MRLQKKGSTYFGLCPFHNEKTGSFSVSPNKQMYYCFGCGAGGNVFTFLMQYENYTFTEAMQVLADRAGIELPKQEMTGAQKREADKRTKLLEINKEAAKYFYKLLRFLVYFNTVFHAMLIPNSFAKSSIEVVSELSSLFDSS